ncbi:MAG: hypothetical protein JWQ01_812 [Massilia sp.]|nr:hypothetical protein [Massilia sp.]
MVIRSTSRLLRGAIVLAGASFAGACGAATSVGVATAKVLPSMLSASVALYTRTAPSQLCSADCAGMRTDRPASVSIGEDGVAQFTLFGETTSNYIVRLSDAAWGARPRAADAPIILEPTLTPGGRVSIVIALAPAYPVTNAFQVVINYN